MKTEAILNATYHYSDIPLSITSAIKSLLGVTELSQLSTAKTRHLQSAYRNFFAQVGETDYHNTSEAYTLRYFPVNFFKIWTPLRDLLLKGQIKENCSILELGCGPGSSTMGLVEFYRILANNNPTVPFKLNFVLVEREAAFCDILKTIYEQYTPALPNNLIVEFAFFNEDINAFFERRNHEKFDYIIESNALNSNEKINGSNLEHHCAAFVRMLKPHSSIIMIEPAKKGLPEYLYQIKNILMDNGLSVFSPCSCNNEVCKLLPMARVDISGISLINDSRTLGVFDEKKGVHSFEYVVIRNDSLTKHQRPQNTFLFCDLFSKIGKTVRFEAYVLYTFDHEESFDLKICDGSGLKREIYLCVAKRFLTAESIDLLSIGRGGYVKVKNAKVVSANRIECSLSTMIEIM